MLLRRRCDSTGVSLSTLSLSIFHPHALALARSLSHKRCIFLTHATTTFSSTTHFQFHAVEILKILEGDPVHGERFIEEIGEFVEAWERYKHQKHDLFLVRTEQQDYFLTDTPASFLSLEDGSAKNAVSAADATT